MINDLAMYSNAFLRESESILSESEGASGTLEELLEIEGVLWAVAPCQASYPVTDHHVFPVRDIYFTGTQRITEYYPGIDWCRYKKNWGQMEPGTYNKSSL